MADTERSQTMPCGVVIERRDLSNPWQPHEWRPVAVIPGAGPTGDWKVLDEGQGWIRFLAATLPLELHRKETEAYRVNLSNRPPVVYVILNPDEDPDSEGEVIAHQVTASPYEAQDYLDCGDIIVEGVPMPDGVVAWMQAFIDRHHVDEPFKKRKRKRHAVQELDFGKPAPIDERRGRKLSDLNGKSNGKANGHDRE